MAGQKGFWIVLPVGHLVVGEPAGRSRPEPYRVLAHVVLPTTGVSPEILGRRQAFLSSLRVYWAL